MLPGRLVLYAWCHRHYNDMPLELLKIVNVFRPYNVPSRNTGGDFEGVGVAVWFIT